MATTCDDVAVSPSHDNRPIKPRQDDGAAENDVDGSISTSVEGVYPRQRPCPLHRHVRRGCKHEKRGARRRFPRQDRRKVETATRRNNQAGEGGHCERAAVWCPDKRGVFREISELSLGLSAGFWCIFPVFFLLVELGIRCCEGGAGTTRGSRYSMFA